MQNDTTRTSQTQPERGPASPDFKNKDAKRADQDKSSSYSKDKDSCGC